jgi:hypothetical protein
MRVPPPLSMYLTGRGKLLSTGIAVISTVFAASAFGAEGVIVLIAAVAIVVVIELWVDSGRVAESLETLTADADGLREDLTAANLREADAQAKAGEIPDLRSELGRRSAEIEALKQELASPNLTLERFLDMVLVHIQSVTLVSRHRHLIRGRSVDWPVVRATLSSEVGVIIKAYVAGSLGRLEDEPVALIARATTDVIAAGRVVLHVGNLVEAAFSLDAMPAELQATLQDLGSTVPVAFVISLAGLRAPPYADLSDAQLEMLSLRLNEVLEAVEQALKPLEVVDASEVTEA